MTVSSTKPIIRYDYQGPGDYSFPFKAFKDSDIEVYYSDVSGHVRLLSLVNSEYSVSINANQDGGTVTINIPANTSDDLNVAGGTLTITRELPITQEVDWVNNDPLDAEILESAFDRIIMILQQQETIITDGTASTNWKGVWQPNTDYKSNDVVTAPSSSPMSGNIYACDYGHTSTGDFDADLAAGYWKIALDVTEVETLRNETLVFRNEASQFAANAQASAQQAANAEANANAAANQATISEGIASAAALNAANCSASSHAGSQLSQMFMWEAEAERLTAKSYTDELEDVPVKIYTSNGDGTFTPTDTNPIEYSAFHWKEKAAAIGGGGIQSLGVVAPIQKTGPLNDPIINIDPTKIAAWDGKLDSVVGTTDEIDIDATDPKNPVISISPNFAGGGGGGGGLEWQTEQSADFLAVTGKGYPMLNGCTMTLPAAPTDNMQIGWKDFDNNFHQASCFIDPGTNPIENLGANVMELDTRGQGGTLVWVTDRWLITDVTDMGISNELTWVKA